MNLHTLTIPPQLQARRKKKEKKKIELLNYTIDFVAREKVLYSRLLMTSEKESEQEA